MERMTGRRPPVRRKIGMFDEDLAQAFAKQRKAELEVARNSAELVDQHARRAASAWIGRAARAINLRLGVQERLRRVFGIKKPGGDHV